MTTLDNSDSAECGWVYILSHPQMSAVKVGFTRRSVRERLDELSVTAVPGAFVWEYGVLVANPDRVERQTHKLLSSHRVASNREFFSCSLPVAVAAVLAATEHHPRIKVHDQFQIEQRAARIRRHRELLDTWVKSEEEAISDKVRVIYAEIGSLKPHFAWFWAGHTFVAAIVFEQLFSVKSEAGLLIAASLAGTLSAVFHQNYVHDRRKSKTSLKSRLSDLELERQVISQHSVLQSQRVDDGNPFELPQIASGLLHRPISEGPKGLKPNVAPDSSSRSSASPSLEKRIVQAESRVIRSIPTIPMKMFECLNCGKTVRLNSNFFCDELRCPAKLLTDA